MKRHIRMAGTIMLALALGLTGCSSSADSEDTVAVQSVSMLAGLGTVGMQNRYAGVVVAQATHSITKDNERTVAKLNVAEGDEVKAGQVLFSYDTDEIQLSIESAQLEVEKLQNTIDTTNKQITEMEKEKKKAKSSEQLSYSIEIQTMQADVKEDEYNIKTKQAEVDRLKKTMENSEVRSEWTGTVQTIKDSSDTDSSDGVYYSDSSDGSDAYITIVETGTYRVKGTVNEMNVSDIGSQEGNPVIIRSRVDNEQTWSGTMGAVDTENTASTNNADTYYEGDSDESTSSSKYNFYVELNESEGLMLGQHVYIELDQGQDEEQTGLNISSFYIDQEEDGTAWVWAATDKDKLEKREIQLGEYNEELDTYEVTGGLTADDYIAIPDESLKDGMPVTRFDEAIYDQGDYEDGDAYADEGYDEGEYTDGEAMDEEYADGEAVEEEYSDGEVSEDEFAEEDAGAEEYVEEESEAQG